MFSSITYVGSHLEKIDYRLPLKIAKSHQININLATATIHPSISIYIYRFKKKQLK